MYSPALLPSRWRAAVAKKRIWSTIGGISSRAGQARSACRCSRTSSGDQLLAAGLDGVGDAEQGQRALARASSRATPRTPSAAAPIAASMSAADDSGAVGVLLARSTGSTTSVVRPSAAWTVLAVDEVRGTPAWGGLYHGHRSGGDTLLATYARTMTAAISTVGVPREIKTAEYRVAMTPDGVRELERHGIEVFVETGAGEGALDQRRRLRGRGRRHRPDRGGRLGAGDGGQGQGAEGGGVRLPPRRPHAVHLPPPRRLPGGGQGADRGGHDRASPTRRCSSTTARCRCWRR